MLFRTEDPQLTAAIARTYDQLMTLTPDSKEFKETTARLTELNALKNQDRIDPNKLVLAIANIFIGIKVLRYEETGVVTTKFMSFMQKL